MSSRAARLRGGQRSSLKRRVATRQPKKTVVVWCEGTETEPQYFEALRSLEEVRYHASVDIKIQAKDGGAVPLTLVRTAVAFKERASIQEGEIDEFWCVFDVEWPLQHPNLREAIDLAHQKGIQLAISNPCFEVWLILHYRDYAGFLNNVEARRARRLCDQQTGKHIASDDYMRRRDEAKRRARVLERMHAKNGTLFPHDNPSAGVYKLLDSVGG